MPETTQYEFSFGAGLVSCGTLVRTRDGVLQRIEYRFDDGRLLTNRGCRMSMQAADLMDVCAALFLADRLAPFPHGSRRAGSEGRAFVLRFPLRDPERWRNGETLATLNRLCLLLINVQPQFVFEQRKATPRVAEGQRSLLPPPFPGPNEIALFSGGLDSLLGLVQAIESDSIPAVMAVTVATHGKQRHRARTAIGELQRVVEQVDLAWGVLSVGIGRGARDIDDRNTEHRARSLLFLASGIAAGDALLGCERLRITENGPGALAVPASSDQRGFCASMGVHPETLAAFEDLCGLTLNRPVPIWNGGLFHTKGELATPLRDSRLSEAARHTVSCDRFPYSNWDQHCGACSSCIFRAAALRKAGVAYIDEGKQRIKASPVPRAALAWHVDDLHHRLAEPDPYLSLFEWSDRIDRAVAVASRFGRTETQARIDFVDLYRRFADEMAAELSAFGSEWVATAPLFALPALEQCATG